MILRLVWCLRDFYWPNICRYMCRCRWRCTATCWSTTVTDEQKVSVSRGSTIRLNMRMVITYLVLQDNYALCLLKLETCSLLFYAVRHRGIPLSDCRMHPGQGQQDSSYILTPCIFLPVDIKVKFCSNKSCKATHQPWPFDKGNILVTAWLFC